VLIPVVWDNATLYQENRNKNDDKNVRLVVKPFGTDILKSVFHTELIEHSFDYDDWDSKW